MYPFVVLGLLWLIAPFAAYFFSNKGIDFTKGLVAWIGGGLSWYFTMWALGFRGMGEEGDYNLWTLLFWVLNYLVFQAMRLQNTTLRTLVLVPGGAFIALSWLWTAVVTFGYVLSNMR
jgi:hypothetical protein